MPTDAETTIVGRIEVTEDGWRHPDYVEILREEIQAMEIDLFDQIRLRRLRAGIGV